MEAVRPRGLYCLRLGSGGQALAGLDGTVRGGIVRLREGDAVEAQVSPRAPNRATILRKL